MSQLEDRILSALNIYDSLIFGQKIFFSETRVELGDSVNVTVQRSLSLSFFTDSIKDGLSGLF